MTPYREPSKPRLSPPVDPPPEGLASVVARTALGLCVLAVWVHAWVVLSRAIGDVLEAITSR